MDWTEKVGSKLYGKQSGLQRQGVSCAMRGGAVRLSPHYYQGKRELEAFFRLLHHIV